MNSNYIYSKKQVSESRYFHGKITCYDKVDGISLEHMVRYGKFDMRVKHFHNEYEIFIFWRANASFFQ